MMIEEAYECVSCGECGDAKPYGICDCEKDKRIYHKECFKKKFESMGIEKCKDCELYYEYEYGGVSHYLFASTFTVIVCIIYYLNVPAIEALDLQNHDIVVILYMTVESLVFSLFGMILKKKISLYKRQIKALCMAFLVGNTAAAVVYATTTNIILTLPMFEIVFLMVSVLLQKKGFRKERFEYRKFDGIIGTDMIVYHFQ